MSFESNTGLGVSNFYGPRTTLEGMGGYVHTAGATYELVMEFSGKNINDDSSRLTETIPQNALVTNVYIDVEEASTLAGTTPTILIGTDGSEVTNGVVVTEAQAEAKGITDITSTKTGTWSSSFAVDTVVGVALGGSNPTITDDGRYKVVIEYVHVTRS